MLAPAVLLLQVSKGREVWLSHFQVAQGVARPARSSSISLSHLRSTARSSSISRSHLRSSSAARSYGYCSPRSSICEIASAPVKEFRIRIKAPSLDNALCTAIIDSACPDSVCLIRFVRCRYVSESFRKTHERDFLASKAEHATHRMCSSRHKCCMSCVLQHPSKC